MVDASSQSEDDLADKPSRWFVRGVAVGVLFMAAVNTLSYFFRSDHFGTILRPQDKVKTGEAIGFPWQMWEAGNTYGGFYVDYPMLGLNVLVAILAAMIVGLFTARRTNSLNDIVAALSTNSAPESKRPAQFSLRGLLISTTVIAVATMLAKNYAANPKTLLAIYLLGPIGLVALAMSPRRLSWQTRVAIVIPATLCLIAVAITVGHSLDIEFDRVLLAIVLCWVPQTALAAILLTGFLLHRLSRSRDTTPSKSTSFRLWILLTALLCTSVSVLGYIKYHVPLRHSSTSEITD